MVGAARSLFEFWRGWEGCTFGKGGEVIGEGREEREGGREWGVTYLDLVSRRGREGGEEMRRGGN